MNRLLSKTIAALLAALMLFVTAAGAVGSAEPVSNAAVQEPEELTWEAPDAEPVEIPLEESEDKPVEIPADRAPARDPAMRTDTTVNVRDYTYEIYPVLDPFPYYLYVKTDNPDPESFLLVDRQSEYITESSSGYIRIVYENGSYSMTSAEAGTYYVAEGIYPDVAYEDESTFRVEGGYIFTVYGAYSDGGEFVLKERTSQGSSILNNSYADTEITVSCPQLKTYLYYLFDTYTDPELTFFENMNALQSAVSSIAIYPHSIFDSERPSTARPYPCLCTSPYPELDFNEHYEMMFARCYNGALLYNAYPFVMDSAGTPGTMRALAYMLNPDCTVTSGSIHAFINVTLDGETHTYGGQGRGGRDPIFTSDLPTLFTFDGSAEDYYTNASIDLFGQMMDQLSAAATAAIEPYRDLIAGAAFVSTIAATGGTWVRVGVEGSSGCSFGYVVPRGSSYEIASSVWIDGKYISQYERIVLGASFESYPTAGILLHNVSYTDYYGNQRCQDVIYRYVSANDDWEARYYYTGSSYYSNSMTLPAELILTRAQVEEIVAAWTDGNRLPVSGLVYDGYDHPGAPFTNVLVEGVYVPEELTIIVGKSAVLDMTVTPADATYQQFSIASSDTSVVTVSSGSTTVRAVAVGTAVVTVTTYDGGFSAQCTVNVVLDQALNDSLNVEGGDFVFTGSGSSPFEATLDDDGSYYACSSGANGTGSATLLTSVTLNAGDRLMFDYAIVSASYYERVYFYINNTQVDYFSNTNGGWRTYAYTAQEDGTYAVKWSFSSSYAESYCKLDNVRILPHAIEDLNAALNVFGGTLQFSNPDTALFIADTFEDRTVATAIPSKGSYVYLSITVDLEEGDQIMFDYCAPSENKGDLRFGWNNTYTYISNVSAEWKTYTYTAAETNTYTIYWRYYNYGDPSYRFMMDNVRLIRVNGPEVVPGDVNGDGIVNFNDISVLSLYLLDLGGLAEGCELNADFNGDGTVDFKDITDMYMAMLG